MTAIILGLIAVFSFLCGLGLSKIAGLKLSQRKRLNTNDRRLREIEEEYRNFLSYDGSEQ